MNGQNNFRKTSHASTRPPHARKSAIWQACRLEPLEGRMFLSVGLDAAVGTGGRVITDLGYTDAASAILATSDGKIIVAGATNNSGNIDIALVRYNPDGALDPTFGLNGRVITDLGSASDAANAIAIGPDGRIYVGGSMSSGPGRYQDFALARYTSDGNLDTTFGNFGVVATDFSKQYDTATSIAIQPDGKIVLGGVASVYGRRYFAVARYSPSGSLDPTFGTGGKSMTPLGSGSTNAEAYAMVLQGDKILLAGATISYQTYTNDLAMVRYNSNGTLDTSFGAGGAVVKDMGFADEEIRGIAIAGDGGIIAAGRSGGDVAVLRFSAGGVLDTSFGSVGMTRIDLSGGQDKAAAVRMTSSGKIVVAGTSNVGAGSDFALVRLDAKGAIDSDFGNGGTFIVDMGSATDTAAGMAVAANGDVVVTGSARGSANDNFATMWVVAGDATTPAEADPPPNVPPVATPGGPYVVDEGGMITLDGAGSSDSDGSIVRYEWDYDYDPAYGFDINGTGPSPVFDASRLDGDREMTIALRVTDDQGASSITTMQLTVRNVAPAADAGADRDAYRGDTVRFIGRFSDPCSDEMLTLSWSVTDPSGAVIASGPGMSFDFVPAVLGDYTVTLSVADDDGGVGTDSAIVHVLNHAPVADAGGAYAVGEGGEVVLSATGSYDIDGGIAGYEWDFDYDGNFAADATGATLTFSAVNWDGPASVIVAVRVTDDSGASSIATATINIGNLPPVVAISGVPADAREGDVISLGSSAVDPSPLDAPALTWTVSKNGNAYAAGAGASFSFMADDNGEYVVTLTATDGDGGIATDTKTILVSNVAPTASISGAVDGSPEGMAIALSGSASDLGILDTLAYAWVVTKDGQPYSTGDAADFSFTPIDDGAYVVTLTVTDKDGGVGSDTRTITVTNVSPTAAINSAPDSAVEGDVITVSGSATDPGLADTFTYAWSVTKDGAAFASGESADFSFTPDDDGTYILTLLAVDKDGGTGMATQTILVSNAAPTAEAGADQSVQAGDHVLLGGQFTDAGTADAHTLAWIVTDAEGQVVASGDGATLDFEPAAGRYVATFTVTDDDGASTSDTLAIDVQAPPPVASLSVTLSGATSGVRGQPLGFAGAVEATGIDGGLLATWDFGDGTVITRLASEAGSLMPSHVFAATGTYQVTLTISDGEGTSAVAQSLVTIEVVQLQPEAGGSLMIGGTAGRDVIVLRPHGRRSVAVYVNWDYFGVFAPERIVVLGQQGADVVWARGVKIPINMVGDGSDLVITRGRNIIPKIDSMRDIFNVGRRILENRLRNLIDGLIGAMKRHR